MSRDDDWVRPNAPDYDKQWGLRMVRAEEAWKIEKGRQETIVAVIEMNLDLDHPDLAGQFLAPYDAAADCPDGRSRTHVVYSEL